MGRAEPWFGRFGEMTELTDLGSVFGFEVRRKEQAEPWFGRFGVLRKIRAEL